MDDFLTNEQQLFQQSLRRLLAAEYDFEKRSAALASVHGRSPGLWAKLAELGVFGLVFSEDLGGFDAPLIDRLIAMGEAGRALVAEPLWMSGFLAADLINGASHMPAAEKSRLAEDMIAGKLCVAVAFAEPKVRFDLFNIETTATPAGDAYRLSGEKCVVIGAPWASHLLITARLANATAHGDVGLFWASAAAPGIVRRDYVTIDGLQASEIAFNKVDVNMVIPPDGDAEAHLRGAFDRATACLCAEAAGCMAAMIEATTEFVKTRQQFGKPIGSFQVIQHRLADMHMLNQQAEALVYSSAEKLDRAPATRAHAVSAAKAMAGKAGRFVGQQAVQLHGGIGITEELPIGHYFKRLTAINITLGDTEHHLQRLAARYAPAA